MTRRQLAAELLLVAALLVVLAPFVWSSAWREDELSQLANASRMLGGEVLYRDYLEILTPLSLWLAAGVFAVTGPSLLAARVVTALAIATSGWLVARMVRLLGTGPLAAWLAALALVLGAFRPFPVWNHHWIAQPLALGAAWLALRGLAEPRARAWLGCGALAGGCLLVTQSDGLVLAGALALALGLLAALGTWRPAEAAQAASRLALGYGAVVGGVALGLLLQGTLDDAWRCAWVWPRAHYQVPGGVNDVLFAHDLGALVSPANGPWPGRLGFYARLYHVVFLFGAIAATAAAALAFGAGLAARRLQGTPATLAQARWGVACVLALAFTALAMRGRADYVHVAFYLPWALVPLAAALDRLRAHLAADAGPALPWLPVGALALFVATGASLVITEARSYPEFWFARATPDARLANSAIVRYIHAHTQPGDRIVALPQGSLAYFYGRPSAGDMNVMLPPRFKYTDEADFQALWRRIDARKPALILVTPDHPAASELADHLRYPLPDYEQAAVVDTPFHTGPRKTWIFRRKAR